MAGVECKLNAGVVCMGHCRGCSHFDELTWHCMYYLSMLQPLEEVRRQVKERQRIGERLEELHRLWEE